MMNNTETTNRQKPWYKNSRTWAWIVTGLCFLALIVIMAIDSAEEKRAKARPKVNRTWYDAMTPEERHKTGLDKKINGSNDWTPPADVKERARKFLENGGNADPTLDALQDSDFYDVIDQLGGEEGF